MIDIITEDRQMFGEIRRINAMCEAMINEFEKVKSEYTRDFEREHGEYLETVHRINSQLEIFDVLSSFRLNESGINHRSTGISNAEKLAGDVSGRIEVGGDISMAAGGAAGLAAGASAVGMVTAFGTAGTGTAISGLTGSAYIHATLAALGGGTLANGGLGMLGGAAVLGVTFLAPAAAVAGYFANKQIHKAYEEARERERRAEIFKTEGIKFFGHCEKELKIFRYINREMYMFAAFFEELINMSVAASAIHKTAEYHEILKLAAETATAFKSLNFVNADGTFNENIIKEIAAVKERTLRCQNSFYEFRTELSPSHQKLLDELKNQQLQNDELQTAIQWERDNYPKNYIVRNRTIRNEFDKALRQATEELDIISAWINFRVVNENMQLAFENLLKHGVVIKILYGIGDMNPRTCDIRNQRTIETAEHLKTRFRHYPNFKMKCTNTHEKLFICDEKFYVNSSLNILSFDARYDGTDMRNEGGEASNNVTLIREYRKLLFNF